MEQTSSIVSALGAGSGIDMGALATQLAEAQYALRTTRLTSRNEVLEQQISSASSIKSSLSLLASALGDRVRVGDLASVPQIANSAVANVTKPAGTTGKGSYSLEVLSLASAQTLSSTAFTSSSDVIGQGTLTIRFGETTGSTFTEDTSQSAVSVTIGEDATLADIASAINNSGSGVTAYVANTSSGAQLVYKGAQGLQSGFIIEATESGTGSLDSLSWDPTNGGSSSQLLATSADASYKLDGLLYSSASNKVGQVAPGLSLDLTGTNNGSPTTISFSDPSSSISSAMEDLVSALNEIAGELNSATNPLTGELASDSGAKTLKRTFAALTGTVIMPNATNNAPRTLSDLGLSIQRDGTFLLDSERLTETLANDPQGAAAMFTNGLFGVYATVDKIARAAARTGDPGSLAGSISRYERLSTEVSDDLSELAEKQESLRATLVSRFARAETRISASQTTLSFLRSQVDVWNSSNN